MTDRNAPKKSGKGDDRQARLAQALRQNLRRRKAQQKGRKQTGKDQSGEDGKDE